jgi:hypothetical protein
MEFQDKCPNCGHPRQEGAAFCSNCGKPFEEPRREETPPPITPSAQAEPPPEQKYVAWEDRENIGFFAGLWETWKESMFNPDRFYARLPYRGGIGNPLLYALIMGWLGVIFPQIYSVLWTGAWFGMMSPYMEEAEMLFGTGLQTFNTLATILLAPFIIVVGLFIISGILHLIFLIFGWSNRDFEATFRAIAYSEGAMLWGVIPFCGGLIGWIWGIVLAIIGLKHMQKTTGGKAALVFFLPVILCCCLATILAIIFGAAIMGFIQEAMNSGYYYN